MNIHQPLQSSQCGYTRGKYPDYDQNVIRHPRKAQHEGCNSSLAMRVRTFGPYIRRSLHTYGRLFAHAHTAFTVGARLDNQANNTTAL